ncbi:hypothetical protein ABK040_003637 [Willaertia magna]
MNQRVSSSGSSASEDTKENVRRGDADVIQHDECSIMITSPTIKHKLNNKSFTFDKVFSESTSQDDLFEKSGVMDLINYAVEGFSTTVFCYGMTGSGKTFTMTGEEDFPGIIPRACYYIFNYIKHIQAMGEEANQEISIKVRASCLEIYQEQVNDLLNLRSTNLPVRWSNKDGFFVEHLFVVECEQLEDLLQVLHEGIANRKVSSHEMNKDSSRSHSIFTVNFEISNLDLNDGFESRRFGRMHFVDLAGSEKLKQSKSTGSTAIETAHINKSLLTLGKVISVLSSPSKKDSYIPYRDSKLTKLLMDSLGGEAKTLMISCITPSSVHSEESLKTLVYASRAKRIRNIPVTKTDPNERYILKLRDEIRQLKEELSHYKSKSNLMSPVSPVIPQIINPVSNTEKRPRAEVKISSNIFPTIERKRISIKQPNQSVSNDDFDGMHLPPILSKLQKAPKLEEEYRDVSGLLGMMQEETLRLENNDQHISKKNEIIDTIEKLRQLLEDEKSINLEKLSYLVMANRNSSINEDYKMLEAVMRAKIKLLSEDNKRLKKILKQNMDETPVDREEFDKLKKENEELKRIIEGNNTNLDITKSTEEEILQENENKQNLVEEESQAFNRDITKNVDNEEEKHCENVTEREDLSLNESKENTSGEEQESLGSEKEIGTVEEKNEQELTATEEAIEESSYYENQNNIEMEETDSTVRTERSAENESEQEVIEEHLKENTEKETDVTTTL